MSFDAAIILRQKDKHNYVYVFVLKGSPILEFFDSTALFKATKGLVNPNVLA